MARAIIHVDMDAFYASVEQRDDPRLRGKPVVVGGNPRRGVVLAASYEVRPFGVRSAMPMARAMRLAPRAIVVPPRFEAYVEASEAVHAIFERYTPSIEPLSLDEAFLDVTASGALFGPPGAIAARIRREIAEELRLPASAGIAPVKFVAKVASDLAKPDGQCEVKPDDARNFLAPLPISRLWGVGPKTEQTLFALGLRTIGDVATRDPVWLEARLGALGLHLHALALAHDDREVVPDRQAKSIGAEDTFAEDLGDLEALGLHVHGQALRVARRLRRAGVRARAVVLKYKLADFRLKTRRTTLPEPTDDGRVLHEHARRMLAEAFPLPLPVRLTGVSAQDLVASQVAQLELFESSAARSRRLNATLDAIALRFGAGAVVPAALADLAAEGPEDEARRRVGAARFDAPED